MKARAKHFQFQLSHQRTLYIVVRRFRLAASYRSKRRSQWVIDLNWFGIKQIAISQRRHRPVGRPKRVASATSFWSWRLSLPLMCIGLGIIGVFYFGSQLLLPKTLQPVKVFATPVNTHHNAVRVLAASRPIHINIPSVGIDADIIPVGLDANGSIALPPLFSWQAGWYSGSPTPGQLGPAIIVGHVDTYKGVSVFWRLREVQSGDSVIINRADGSKAIFKITGLDQYDQHTFPTASVYQNLPYAGLKLITCGGTFDNQTQHYTENTVVSAVLSL